MTIYPTNFDKQKVRLRMDVFNGKVVTQLEMNGPGVQELIKLLIEKGIDYCLTAEFQSDRIEGGFGT